MLERMRAPLIASIALVLAANAHAAPPGERVVPLPEGWYFHGEGLAIGERVIAVSGTRHGDTGEGARIVATRIFQTRESGTVFTDFPGKCTARAFSPDGELLLAVLVDPEGDPVCCEGCPVRAVLIGADGREVWRSGRLPLTTFGFAGNHTLYSAGRCNMAHCHGDEITLWDLRDFGERTIRTGPYFLASVIADGAEALLVDRDGPRRVALEDPVRTRWSRHFEVSREHPQAGRLDDDRWIVWDEDRRFQVFDADGVVLFGWDPGRLAEDDPLNDADHVRYAGVRAAPDGRLWLTHGGEELLIDPADGSRARLAVDRETPPGFVAAGGSNGPYLEDDWLVLFAEREVRVRPLWGDEGVASTEPLE
jgi:hypothetical protein